MDREYRFRIADSYTPATLPMERLAEYMAALAVLLGEIASVHFRSVETGSAVLLAVVDEPARPKVRDRVRAVRDGIGPNDAMAAFHDLDEMLRRDNATGALTGDGGTVVVPFPGRTRPEPLVFGPFRQDGTIDGQIIRVGGRDETVPVHLQEGAVIHTGLHATREIARQLGQLIFGPIVRVHGSGSWLRSAGGAWELRSFKITDFEVLDETPLAEVVAKLRAVKGNRWNEVSDPVRTLLQERHGEGDAH
jgi:hypothetical protein